MRFDQLPETTKLVIKHKFISARSDLTDVVNALRKLPDTVELVDWVLNIRGQIKAGEDELK